jgi:hypothetical protein
MLPHYVKAQSRLFATASPTPHISMDSAGLAQLHLDESAGFTGTFFMAAPLAL